MHSPKGSVFRKLHYLLFCIWVLWKTLWWRPNYLYASDLLSCPAALLVCLLTGIQIILHEHDSPHLEQNVFSAVLFWTRAQLARRTFLNVLPSAGRAKIFQAHTHASAVQVVWNCPSLQEMLPLKDRDARDPFLLYYHGNISSTLLPLSVIGSLKFLPEAIMLRIVGYETLGSVGYLERLKDAAISLGVAHRVSISPPVPRSALLRLCQDADVGLAFFPAPTSAADSYVGASNKVFDYLCCGVPVLISNHAEWQFVCDTGIGLTCEQSVAKSIAASVLWFYNHKQETRSMGERGRQKILDDWNYETQFEPVFRALRGCRDATRQP
jgi:glycosyltransferase involved in cell wall biosynthesis